MNRADAEILVASALHLAGVIPEREVWAAIARAANVPVFRCQDFMNWPHGARFGYRCKCGENISDLPPCPRCDAERTELFEPTGRRRIFNHG